MVAAIQHPGWGGRTCRLHAISRLTGCDRAVAARRAFARTTQRFATISHVTLNRAKHKEGRQWVPP